MGRRLGLVGAALVSGVTVATAVPSLSIGSNSEVFLTGSATVRYDDNVLLDQAGSQSDTIFVLNPGIALEYSEGSAKGGLSFGEQFIRYSDNSSLDSDLAAIIGEFRRGGAKSEFFVGGSYRELSQNSIRVRSFEQTVRRDLTAFRVGGTSGLSAKTTVALSADYQKTNYQLAGFVDSTVWSIPVDLYLQRTEKLDLSVGYRFRDSRLSGNSPDSKDHFLNIGARGDFTPKLGGQVRVGYNRRNLSNNADENQLGVGASLTYVFTPKTSFEFGISNDFSTAATGASQKVFAINGTGHFDLTPKLSAVAGLSFDSSEYADGRKDDFSVAELGFQYALSEHWATKGEYVFRKNDSNASGLSFDNNVLSLSLSCRY